MIPLSNFRDILVEYKDQAVKDYDELIMAADILSQRPNFFTMDDNGQFFAQACGPLDETIRALEHHLTKLYKIKTNQGK